MLWKMCACESACRHAVSSNYICAPPYPYVIIRVQRTKEVCVIELKKKVLLLVISMGLLIGMIPTVASAATTYTVVKGDAMWRIAVRYEVGLDEIKKANPHIKNPALIYPGDVLTIPTTSDAVLAYEAEVVRLVNEQRAKHGLGPLTQNWQLSRVARYKSQDMSENWYFSHTSPTYGSPFQMIKSFGISYRTAGENIARGYTTPQAVVEAWMNSAGHRANILNASFTEIGVGYVASGRYWTQMFIGTP